MASNVTLTAPMRANLYSLQQTAELMSTTQNRLATGKKVNTALDNPVNFFASQANLSRANDLTSLKDAMNEAIQTINNANNGITSLTSLINQAKALGQSALGATKNQVKIQFSGVANAAVITVGGTAYTGLTDATSATFDPAKNFQVTNDMATTVANLAKLINAQTETTEDMTATVSGSVLVLQIKDNTKPLTNGNYSSVVTAGVGMTLLKDSDGYSVFSDRKALGAQYESIVAQIDAIAGSAGYRGVNLLGKDSLNIKFESSALVVKGFSAAATDLGMNTTATHATTGVGWGWSLDSEISSDLGKLDTAISTLRSKATDLSNNLSMINIQKDFSTNVANTLQTGSDNLTLADTNEEGANMLMLQTRQALSTQALSIASQAAQSVMRLFG
jgi:flagellin